MGSEEGIGVTSTRQDEAVASSCFCPPVAAGGDGVVMATDDEVGVGARTT